MLKTKEQTSHLDNNAFNSGRWKALKKVKDILDTIEVKEVDLEKEIKKYSMELAMKENNGDWLKDITTTAKHFFELGMQVSNKVQKGE